MSMVLFGVNEFGGYTLYDHIYQGVVLSVDLIPGYNDNIPWAVNTFGCVRMPNMKDLREDR